ncbi:small subunit ribosomal protein S7 [Entomortierella parvispora]|uniref:Small subunit ribosomal protein S7 n=1 Tax=Entomortierella parvispora TaxID=205924 RepID=A0A9P3M0F0_9FUNG|nr:small subunit ribosomal protein S7 [Entomortierella parvispora]
MLRNFARLGGVTTGLWRQQHQAVAVSRIALASFHMGTRSNAVAASSNAATTPSTPLPPPMNTEATTSTTTVTSASTTPSEPAVAAPSPEEASEPVEEKSAFAEFTPVSPEQARSLTQNPILSQLVNTIMKDGKKARAQRFVADAMLEIRKRTQSDPYHVILDALELASPILKLTAIKKGSKVLQVPTPMTERQRRRKAMVWILEASDKRKRGELEFKDRLASEFLAVVNGNSGALVKKNQQHKMALANRANASLKY